MSKIAGLIIVGLLALLLCWSPSEAARPIKFDSAATTNSVLVRGGNAKIFTIVLVNTTTTLYYLKLYDVSAAPTCASDEVKWKVPIPFGSSNAGGGAIIPISDGLDFDRGAGMCITANSADNDNTAAATGIAVSFAVK